METIRRCVNSGVRVYKIMCHGPRFRLLWLMLGQIFTFVMHVSNLTFLELVRKSEAVTASEDPDLKRFQGLMYRQFVCWTAFTQILNSILGFVCDVKTFISIDDASYSLPPELEQSREIMFAAVVWPCSLMVSTVFWSLYIYDRSLIHPEILDAVIGPASNHILHSLIVPIVLWEVLLRKRQKPTSHWRHLAQLVTHMILYLCMFYSTFYYEGIWVYPIFEKTYGTVDFLTLHLAIATLLFLFYYLQWGLNDFIHFKKEKKKEKKK